MALPVAGLVNTLLPTNPFPLGVTTVSGTPGTATKITHNFTDLDGRFVKWLSIRALDTNTGLIYVLINSAYPMPPQPTWTLPGGGTTNGADTTNFLNVVQVLSAGETWSIPAQMLNQIRIGQFCVDGSVGGDNAIASFYEA